MMAMLIHFSKGKFYMLHVDPEYFHLFNGINLAIFNLAIDFIHHPGTTIQMIFAFSAPVVNFILPGTDLVGNMIDNPELFIHGASILLNILTAGTLFALGYFTYRNTGNIWLAMLLQLMPLGHSQIILITGRLIPETAVIAPLLLLGLITVKFLYDRDRVANLRKYVIGFAVVGGLGMAGKFLYLPFLIIPLLIIPGFKEKTRYTFYTLIATMVFAFPVFVNLG
jgi:hypothetical protein